jgi:hypothetical protein
MLCRLIRETRHIGPGDVYRIVTFDNIKVYLVDGMVRVEKYELANPEHWKTAIIRNDIDMPQSIYARVRVISDLQEALEPHLPEIKALLRPSA